MKIKNIISYLGAMGLMAFISLPMEVSAIKTKQKMLIASNETDSVMKFNFANNGIFNAPGVTSLNGNVDCIQETTEIGSLFIYPRNNIYNSKIGNKRINYWVAGNDVSCPILMNQQSSFGFYNIFNTWSGENGGAPVITADLIADAFYYCMRDEYIGVIPPSLSDKIDAIRIRLGDDAKRQNILKSFFEAINDIVVNLGNVAPRQDRDAIPNIINQFPYKFVKNISKINNAAMPNFMANANMHGIPNKPNIVGGPGAGNIPNGNYRNPPGNYGNQYAGRNDPHGNRPLDGNGGMRIDMAANNKDRAPICAFWASERNLGICEFADAVHASLLEIVTKKVPLNMAGKELIEWIIGKIRWFECHVYLMLGTGHPTKEDSLLLQIVGCSSQLLSSHRLLKLCLDEMPISGSRVASHITNIGLKAATTLSEPPKAAKVEINALTNPLATAVAKVATNAPTNPLATAVAKVATNAPTNPLATAVAKVETMSKPNEVAVPGDQSQNQLNQGIPGAVKEILTLWKESNNAIKNLVPVVEKSLLNKALVYFRHVFGVMQDPSINMQPMGKIFPNREVSKIFPKKEVSELRKALNLNASSLQKYTSQLQRYIPQLRQYVSELQQIGASQNSQIFIDGINSVNIMLSQVVGYCKCLDKLFPSSVDRSKLAVTSNNDVSKLTKSESTPVPGMQITKTFTATPSSTIPVALSTVVPPSMAASTPGGSSTPTRQVRGGSKNIRRRNRNSKSRRNMRRRTRGRIRKNARRRLRGRKAGIGNKRGKFR
jgi:hypothetical protein